MAGGKTRAIARRDAYEKIYLHASEADGEHLPVHFKTGWPQPVYPYREGIAIYMGAKRDSLDLHDPARGEAYDRVPIDVDKECSKLATETEPDRLLMLGDQGRAYVQFECVVIGA